MRIRIGWILLAAVLAEIFGLAALVVLVVIFSPGGDQESAQAFAESLGFWVGPVSGFVFCLLGGYLVASRAKDAFLLNGLGVGIAGAILDLGIVFAAGVPFKWIFVISNTGRVIAGLLGGMIASRRSATH